MFDVPTDGNKTHTYDLELYFPNQSYDQNIEQQKQINAYVTVENFDYSIFLPYDKTKGVNRPVLFAGMTPVKWDEELNEIETNIADPDWYDYKNKKWANAKTADGSYWVWIPRYGYKISSGYHSNNTGTINIVFLKEDTIENETTTTIQTKGYIYRTKDTSLHYFLHPAFNVEGSELGFWVAKFEPSGTSSNINILPNATSLTYMTIGEQFDAAINMKSNPKYGWDVNEVDTHMFTNQEWGAVTYLSKSLYGANAEIWINNNKNYITGCGGESVSASPSNDCNTYNTPNGQKSSTTHNIYGIYDMSGGSQEYVSAYLNNGHENLETYGQSILNTTSKYKNIYNQGASDSDPLNYEANKNIYGDAVYETSNTGDSISGSWYGDYAFFPLTSIPWFLRGGHIDSRTGAGLFNFSHDCGYDTGYYTFRPSVRSAS